MTDWKPSANFPYPPATIAEAKCRMLDLRSQNRSNDKQAIAAIADELGMKFGHVARVLSRWPTVHAAPATPVPDAVVTPAAKPSLPAAALIAELFRIDLKTRAVVWSATGENAQHTSDVWTDEPIVLLGFYALCPVDVMAVLTLGHWPDTAEDLTPSIRRSDWAEAQRRFNRNAKQLETSHAA